MKLLAIVFAQLRARAKDVLNQLFLQTDAEHANDGKNISPVMVAKSDVPWSAGPDLVISACQSSFVFVSAADSYVHYCYKGYCCYYYRSLLLFLL